MKFVVEQKALVDALGRLRKVVERQNTIPILGNVLLKAKGGRLTMVATDLDIEITESVPAVVETSGSATAPAHMLHDMAKKLPKGAQIEIALIASGMMTVRAGRAKYDVAVLPPEDFPGMASGGGGTVFTMPASELRAMIGAVKIAMSTEETRFYLNGFYFHIAGKALRAVSTDGHRLTLYDAPLPTDAGGMTGAIVPRKTAGQIESLLDGIEGDVTVTVTDTKIAVEFGDIRLLSKLVDGTFPDYSRVIPKDNPNTLVVGRDVLAEVVDRAGVVVRSGAAVRLTLGATGNTISAAGADIGSSSEDFDGTYTGKPIEIGFNSKYLGGLIGQVDGSEISFELGDPGSPAVIRDPSVAGVLHVLMPMRV